MGRIAGGLFIIRTEGLTGRKKDSTKTHFFFEAGHGLWRCLLGIEREMNVGISSAS